MIYLGSVALVLAIGLVLNDIRHGGELQSLRVAFETERLAWVKERRDLNNRIQVPDAAPYLTEDDPDAGRDDLPTLPEFAVNEEELERAKAELAAAGYESGPVV